MALTVEIVTPDATTWSGEAASVSVPALDGDLGILPRRQPLLAILRPGTVRITPVVGQPTEVQVAGGFASVDADVVTIVVEDLGEELDQIEQDAEN